MTLSDSLYADSGAQAGFVEGGPMPIRKTEFYPHFQTTGNGAAAPATAAMNRDAVPADAEQRISEAYAKGFADGQAIAAKKAHGEQQHKDVLAKALEKLQITDGSKLNKLLWESLLILFRKAVGSAQMDEQAMQDRCLAAVDLISSNMQGAQLHVSASDAELLAAANIPVPVVADKELLPGSVCLLHKGGVILSGTAAIEEEIESRIQSC